MTRDQYIVLGALWALVVLLWAVRRARRPVALKSHFVAIDHDGNVHVEWQAEKHRVGLLFGTKPVDSGWYVVSKADAPVKAEACEKLVEMDVEKFADALKLVGAVK